MPIPVVCKPDTPATRVMGRRFRGRWRVRRSRCVRGRSRLRGCWRFRRRWRVRRSRCIRGRSRLRGRRGLSGITTWPRAGTPGEEHSYSRENVPPVCPRCCGCHLASPCMVFLFRPVCRDGRP